MTIIVAHNHYQRPGGEDVVFRREAALLEAHGHRVIRFTDHNDRIREMSAPGLLGATLWNQKAYRRLLRLVKKYRAEIVHFHNTFPLLSPACYYAARRGGAAVVQTLHNYRLLCPGATFFREGKACDACSRRLLPWPAIHRRCYRGSLVATAGVSATTRVHRFIGTYSRQVDAFIALTEFSRSKFVEAGLPESRLHVKSIFLMRDPGRGPEEGRYALFVGRLAPEKGLSVALEVWRQVGASLPLRIVGDGLLAPQVECEAATAGNVVWERRLSHEEYWRALEGAAFLIVPSLWYEGLPGVVVEAFAAGRPVIASRIGSLAEIVRDGETGVLFEPGSPAALAAAVERLAGDPAERRRLGENARREYLRRYTAEENYCRLMQIYQAALAVRHAGEAVAPAVQAQEEGWLAQ